MNNLEREKTKKLIFENIEVLIKAHVILMVAYPQSHAKNTQDCDCDIAVEYRKTFENYIKYSAMK